MRESKSSTTRQPRACVRAQSILSGKRTVDLSLILILARLRTYMHTYSMHSRCPAATNLGELMHPTPSPPADVVVRLRVSGCR